MKQTNMKQNKKGGFLPTLLVALSASLLGSVLIGRGVIGAGEGVINCLMHGSVWLVLFL